ncbi:MAG TPA: GNAT family N-acetyltransferase [Sediminibacterium sp.]|nr:GNAT family N-acetyltransferase [Sediminibacterium sp.]
MTETLSIMTAGMADLPLLASISRETFADTFSAYNTAEDMQAYADTYFTDTALLNEMKTPGHQFLLAFKKGNCAGYALIREETTGEMPEDTAMELARLYVRPPFIGQGIGKHIMEQVMQSAGDAGKTWLWLGVWEFNLRAIRFYRSFGFEKFAEHDFVLGKDIQRDWLMRKKI